MSINLPNWQVIQYKDRIMLNLQQAQSKLRATVTSASDYKSKQASPVENVGLIEAERFTTKFAPMAFRDVDMSRRWVFPEDYKVGPQRVDKHDLMRVISDPKSALMQSAVNAINRQFDRVVRDAFFATAKTGEQGASSESFGTALTTAGGYNVAVATGAGAATGLNIEKLAAARQALLENHVDLDAEPAFIAITAKQERDLLKEAEVKSSEFNGGNPVLVNGSIRQFYGFNFIQYQGLVTGTDDAASTSRMCPVWVPSGMHLAVWQDMEVNVSQRNDLEGIPWQLYHDFTCGATRIELGRVLRIWCYES